MKKILIMLVVLMVSLTSYSQYQQARQNGILAKTETFVTNSLGNSISNSVLTGFNKDSTAIAWGYPSVQYWKFTSSTNDGTPTSIAWFDSSGYLKRSALPNWIITESDPKWTADKVNYYDKTTTININGTTQDLSSNRVWTIAVGSVTSVGITGTEFSIISSPITTTGNIGLALATTGITAGKDQIPYIGVTDAGGNYTVSFGKTYTSVPNMMAALINPNVRDTPIPVVTTVNIQRRTDVLGLLPTYANLAGGSIHVLITEN